MFFVANPNKHTHTLVQHATRERPLCVIPSAGEQSAALRRRGHACILLFAGRRRSFVRDGPQRHAPLSPCDGTGPPGPIPAPARAGISSLAGLGRPAVREKSIYENSLLTFRLSQKIFLSGGCPLKQKNPIPKRRYTGKTISSAITDRGGVDGDGGEAHARQGDCCEPCGG
jgi:hypothetical protein